MDSPSVSDTDGGSKRKRKRQNIEIVERNLDNVRRFQCYYEIVYLKYPLHEPDFLVSKQLNIRYFLLKMSAQVILK